MNARLVNSLTSALGAGLLFGIGLWVSGMANPKKVLGFLDVTGDWDASLLLVMGGAVAVTVVSFRFILSCPKPFLANKFHIPEKKDINFPLLLNFVTKFVNFVSQSVLINFFKKANT